MSSASEPTVTSVRECPIADALAVVGDRWSLLILRELFLGVHRFTGIRAATGAPREMLSARLSKLVEHGVIERRRYREHPPRDEYHLTPAGRDLGPVLVSLRRWGEQHRGSATVPPR